MGIIARQSIKGTIVNYLGVFVGFLTTFIVLTRFLSAEEIGLARVLIDTSTLFMGLAQLGTSSSIIRFFPYFKEGDKNYNGFFFWTIFIPLIGFCIFALLYLLFQAPLQSYFTKNSPLLVKYYYAVIPMAFFMLYQAIFETNANVLMRIVVPKMVRELFLRLFLLADYLLLAFDVVSINGFVTVLCLCYGLAALCNIVYLFAFGHISIKPNFKFVTGDLTKKYLLYTLFQITAAIATVLTPFLSSLFIASQKGLALTGIFSIATYIAAMVSIPYRSLNAIANPQLAQTTKDGDIPAMTRLLKKVSNISLLTGMLILSCIWINIDFIFYVLPEGSTYQQARYVVLMLGVSQLLICAFNATTSVLNFSKYYFLSLIYSFILTIASFLLNAYLIPIYDINGGALANLLAYALYYCLLCITMKLACHTSPFSIGQLKTLVITSILIGACYAFDHFAPSCNIWVASIIKTTLWGLCVLTAYYWKISQDMNDTMLKILHQLHIIQ